MFNSLNVTFLYILLLLQLKWVVMWARSELKLIYNYIQ
jgi:hypothetical protein